MKKVDQSASSSKFAWLTAPGSREKPAYDIVVAQNEHFVAMPSLGSIVPGWMLLVPRRPMTTLSLMNSDERQSLEALRTEITERLASYRASAIFAFEHGGHTRSVVSCGVDRAHLHLVPLDFDLIEAARKHDLGWQPCVSVSALSEDVTSGREYLFAESTDAALIGFPKAPTSQWFRRLIAQECGVEEWDYKTAPKLEQIKATAANMMPRSTTMLKN